MFGLRRGKWVSLKHPGEATDGWRGTGIGVCLCVMGGVVELGDERWDESRVEKGRLRRMLTVYSCENPPVVP